MIQLLLVCILLSTLQLTQDKFENATVLICLWLGLLSTLIYTNLKHFLFKMYCQYLDHIYTKQGQEIYYFKHVWYFRGPVRYSFTHEVLEESKSIWKGQDVTRDRRISIILRCQPWKSLFWKKLNYYRLTGPFFFFFFWRACASCCNAGLHTKTTVCIPN